MIASSGQSVRRSSWRTTFGVLLVVLVLLGASLAAYSYAARHKKKDSAGPTPFSYADPAPTPLTSSSPIGPGGGTYTAGTVSLTIPAGAVATGTTITPQTAPAGGSKPAEIFGQPVGVEHTAPLGKPPSILLQKPPAELYAKRRPSISNKTIQVHVERRRTIAEIGPEISHKLQILNIRI